jgi:SAM-dependent methyltransferase/predicted enzyme related to lactoylglutathione lyase
VNHSLFILYIADQERSTAFYARVLGRAPSLHVPGMTEFALSEGSALGLMPERGIKRILGDPLPDPAGAAGIPRAEVYLVVDDAASHHARALEAGARELSPLAPRDWGDRAAYSLDPDGHVLAFAERPGTSGGNAGAERRGADRGEARGDGTRGVSAGDAGCAPGEPSVRAALFDGHAPEYDSNVFTKNTLSEVEFLIRELGLAPGASVLDVGCGTGRHAVELARHGFRVTGVDISPGMLAEAKKRASEAGVEVAWVQADAARFTLEGRFDAAICLCEGAFGLLGTADDSLEQPLAILGNISRLLKPQSKCLFTVLSAFRMVRNHPQADVASGAFDPLALAERSEISPQGHEGPSPMRERGFVPTELRLLFGLAGLETLGIWGGTAGTWGKRPIDLDEYEIMVLARKASPPKENER